MGAPVGNKNAVGSQETERPFRDALRRAIAQEDGKRLRAAAERLLDLAAMGEAWAVKELAERMDGKAPQSSEVKLSGQVNFLAALQSINTGGSDAEAPVSEGQPC